MNPSGVTENNASAPSAGASKDEVADFHLIKSMHYRSIHADGAIGSITPNGFVALTLYNERAYIPKELSQTILPNGELGPVVRSEGLGGFTRELEVSVFLSPRIVASLYHQLGFLMEQLKARGITIPATAQTHEIPNPTAKI